MRFLPDCLTLSRAVLAPILLYVAFALEHRLGPIFLILYVLGFLTDVFDGRLARMLGTVNPTSATLDSICDLLFQGCAIVCAFTFRGDVVAFYCLGIALAVSAQLLNWIIGFAKFKKFVSYHTELTKLWSVVLFFAIVELCVSRTSAMMIPMLGLAILSNIEECAISLISRCHRTDVRSFSDATKYAQRTR